MNAENMVLFQDLPQDNPGAIKKPSAPENTFSENFRRIVEDGNLSLAEIVRESEKMAEEGRGAILSWGTLMGWYKGLYKAQILDKRLKTLSMILDVSLEELVFGENSEIEIHNGGAY